MPGLHDPNDPAFTSPSQNGAWQWDATTRRWEMTDPVLNAMMRLPRELGLEATPVFTDAAGSDVSLGMAGNDRARMGALLSQLQTQAATGGGAWEQALKQNTDTANSTAMALGQSLGDDNMSSSRAIGNARAANNQRAVGQGNLLRAQTQQQAQGQLSDIFAGQGALDAQGAIAQSGARQGLLQANRSLESAAAGNRQQFVGGFAQMGMGALGAMGGGKPKGMSEGGRVPGEPEVFGDSSVNDTVPAKLSPLEIVLPLSVTMRPDAPRAAADFVAAVKARHPQSYEGGEMRFDAGGEVPTFGDVDSSTSGGLQRDPTSNILSVRPTTGPVPTPNDPFASQSQAPSIDNGGLIDTRPYMQSRDASLSNADSLLLQAQGYGPSVAPQAMQNATDTTIAQAMQSRAPLAAVVGGAAEQQQGAAGNAAGLVAGETQRGAVSFAEALQRQRAQDLALATQQQQAAWRNSMMNAGLGLEQQAQLRNLLSATGQGAMGLAGIFSGDDDGPIHSGSGGSHDSYSSDLSAHDDSMSHDSGSEHYAEGGVVKKRDARDARRKRTFNDVGARRPDQGSPEDWTPFPEPPTQKRPGAQTEDDVAVGGYAEGGPVFFTGGAGQPQPGPFSPQPPTDIPSALMALRSILTQPAFMRPPGGPRGEDIPLPPEQQAQRLAMAPPPKAPPAEPPMAHGVSMTQRPFATPASRAPMPAQPAAPAQPQPAKPGGTAAPKVDPYAEQQKALGMKADAESALANEQAGILSGLQSSLQQSAIEQKEIQARAQESAEQQLGVLQQAREELKAIDTTVDPDRYMAQRGWGGKIAAVIGLALGAVGNDNGINRAAQLLNQQIDRDLDAQKAEHELALRKGQSAVDSAQTIYALSRQMTQDDIAANLAARGTMLDLAKNQVDIAAAKAGAPMAKANLANLSAQLGVEKQKADDALRQRSFDNRIKLMAAETDRMQAEAQMAGTVAKAATGDKTQQALIANVEQEHKTIQEQGQQLKAMIKKYGTSGGLTGPGKAEMQQALTNIATAQAKLRDPNSVARSSEVDAELRNLFQPGFLQKEDTAIKAIDNYLKNAEQRRNDAYQVRGLTAPGAVPESSSMPTATGKDGKKVKWNGSAWVPM